MGYPTDIEWTDATWNPIGGCSIKSPGCIHCYAQLLAGTRLINHPLYRATTDLVKGKPVFNGKMTVLPDDHPRWTETLKWRGAKNPVMGAGMPSLIFVADMSDLFHENRPRHVVDKVVTTVINSRHVGQLLTKRAKVMCDYFVDLGVVDPDLWLGASAERQQELDERGPYLRRLAELGFTIFISYEPALGPLRLPKYILELGKRAQVIGGGESGGDRRFSEPNWFRALRDQCLDAGVPYFHKQMTGKTRIPPDLMVRQFPATKPLPVAAAAPSAPEPQMRLL
jgi:protein gp37